MKPVLFEIFGFAIPSYTVFMVLGYVVALGILFRITPTGGAAERGELERAQVWDLYIVMIVSSVIGAKVGHVLFEASGHIGEDGRHIDGLIALLREDPWHWARLGEGGYVWYGGLLGALASAAVYFRRRPHLRAWLYSDAFAPAIMAGAAVGRVGCFVAGCCFGKPTDLPWGVFMAGDIRHPTQIYDALVALALAAFLFHRFSRRKFDGENIALLLAIYAPLRALTEAVRGDAERGHAGPLSTSQWISIPIFAIGVGLYAWRARGRVRDGLIG